MKYFYPGETIEFVLTQDMSVTFPKHNHISKYVAGLLLQGEAILFDGEQNSQLTQDDLFIIPIYQVHSITIDSKATKLLTMCIGTDFLSEHTYSEGALYLKKLLDDMIKDGVIEDSHKSAYLDAYEMIYHKYTERIQLPESLSTIADQVIEEPERDWKLDELASSIYIDKYYLIRQFKKSIGLTPHSFQIQNRVRKAQHLLQQGHSVADVAAQMGFYDQSHFDKAFRSVVGLSPKEYLESI